MIEKRDFLDFSLLICPQSVSLLQFRRIFTSMLVFEIFCVFKDRRKPIENFEKKEEKKREKKKRR